MRAGHGQGTAIPLRSGVSQCDMLGRDNQPLQTIQQDQYLHLVCNPSGTFPLLERRVVAWLKSSKNTVLILLRMFKSAKPKLYIFLNYLKVFKVNIWQYRTPENPTLQINKKIQIWNNKSKRYLKIKVLN